MAKKKHTSLETTADLAFVRSGLLNTIIYHGKEELLRIPATSAAFLEDPRIVRSSNMDQVTFNKSAVFKVTLDFLEPILCLPETAVRESTDWILCSCNGANVFYSKVEQRLVLSQCTVSLQSNIAELTLPFTLVLRLDDDEWLVERVLR